MADGCKGPRPVTPLVSSLLAVLVGPLRWLQVTAIYLYCCGLPQYGLHVPVGDWMLLLSCGIKHLPAASTAEGLHCHDTLSDCLASGMYTVLPSATYDTRL